jgi:hypothetical protein
MIIFGCPYGSPAVAGPISDAYVHIYDVSPLACAFAMCVEILQLMEILQLQLVQK